MCLIIKQKKLKRLFRHFQFLLYNGQIVPVNPMRVQMQPTKFQIKYEVWVLRKYANTQAFSVLVLKP
jgi:hypothetical protein